MITIVTGPPCGGKSTYANAHAADGDVVIDFDVLASAFGAKTSHAATGDVRDVTQAARRAAIAQVLDGIQNNAWIVHTWPTDSQLESYKAAGASFIECDPGMDVALERAGTDSRLAGTDNAIRAWYAKRDGKSDQMTMKVKAFDATIVGVGATDSSNDLQPGQFRAIVSVFDNIDSYGEVLRKGAFTRTLAEWEASGDPIPVIWMHDWRDPFAHVGVLLSAVETDAGLEVVGEILDLDENQKAAHVHRLLKGRRVTQFSFGFDVVEAASAIVGEREVFEILDVTLFEVGPCLLGVNRATELIDAKSDGPAAPSAAPTAPPAPVPAADVSRETSTDDNSQADPAAAATGDVPPENATASKGMNPASLLLDTTARIMQNKE